VHVLLFVQVRQFAIDGKVGHKEHFAVASTANVDGEHPVQVLLLVQIWQLAIKGKVEHKEHFADASTA
jgi:hypothetical protein